MIPFPPVASDDEAMTIVEAALAREPDEVLTHSERGPYLLKWLVERRADGSARYVHRFLRPDGDPDHHNHPWDNRTRVVIDGFDDESPDGVRSLRPGDVLERRAEDFHRVEFVPGLLPVTIFDHGPKRNAWAFRTADGTIVPWRDYVAGSGAYRR